MIRTPLSAHADEVENVLIYISDSLRYDYLPEAVRNTGVSGRAFATSTFTATGYPSILTGQYPSTHKVWSFQDTLAESPALLNQYERSGIDATHVWTDVDDPIKKPPLRIPGETRSVTLAELDSPFVLIVHDPGGHMIYGRSDNAENWSSHSEFFADFSGQQDEIARLYREGVAESAERFRKLVQSLKSRGDLDDTLVVFTSDHGELLGEYGGLYGHNVPLVPELVEVPLVVAGAGLPQGERLEGVFSTTDIAPTALSALGVSTSKSDGEDLWKRKLTSQRIVRAEVWKRTAYPGIGYKATSVWTGSGGRVRHLNSFASRLLHLIGVQFYLAPHAMIVRRSPWRYSSLAAAHLKRSITYGEVSQQFVDEAMITDFSKRNTTESVPEPDTEQLRELGYLE